jgi:hypothetical protein
MCNIEPTRIASRRPVYLISSEHFVSIYIYSKFTAVGPRPCNGRVHYSGPCSISVRETSLNHNLGYLYLQIIEPVAMGNVTSNSQDFKTARLINHESMNR